MPKKCEVCERIEDIRTMDDEWGKDYSDHLIEVIFFNGGKHTCGKENQA